ncbi:hypothetical protein [Limosilactobacillus fastidiosus]|uniref:hypothetical protein n=1 Tax=Limosilactobacillus fastidiosus TaxID=2759855 RepID=UPI001C725430|nr:hypothetical protein [Limosilactobacillus fastidiosus]
MQFLIETMIIRPTPIVYKELVFLFSLPVGIGEIHAMHELFKLNPPLAIIVLLLLICLAFYLKNK